RAARTPAGLVGLCHRGSSSEPENVLGVCLHQHLLVLRRDAHPVVGGNLVGRLLVRIIHRIEHPLRPELLHAEPYGRLPGHTAGSDPDVIAEIVAYRLLELARGPPAARPRSAVYVALHPIESV